MNKRKKWIVTAVILVVFCAVLGVYRHFGPGSSASDADPAAVSAPRKKSVLNVNGLVVRPQSLADGITMVGNLLPDEEVDLSFETSGKIVEINFKEGSIVRKGELLAKVNNGEELTWEDLDSANWSIMGTSSPAGYIYPALWLQDHYGKGISDLSSAVQSDSYASAFARLASGQVDVLVTYADARRDYAERWNSEFGREGSIWEETNVIGVTAPIYNDTISVSKNSPIMDDDLIAALQDAFINIGNTDEGKQVIAIYSHNGYQKAQSSDYDNERAAQKLIQELTAAN